MTLQKLKLLFINKQLTLFIFMKSEQLIQLLTSLAFFILWEQLEIEQVYSTPITDGSGTITIAHGVMPIPVPAVMELRKETNLIIQQDFEIKTELVTPTGLAIFKELSLYLSHQNND